MSTSNEIKLKKLLELHIPGTVILASWLKENGFSHDLQQRYRKSGWLESIGVGAFKRPNEALTWQGALFSMQRQAGINLHAGGLTALSFSGYSHYLRTESEIVYLISGLNTNLPAWFRAYPWQATVKHFRTTFLPDNTGLHENKGNSFHITISSAERAIFECLYLSPDKMDLMEVYQIFSGMVNLRPDLVQELLGKCTSVKVKRLFLYMLKKAKHQWGNFLNLKDVTLGTGARSIVTNGVYDPEYMITIPEELARL